MENLLTHTDINIILDDKLNECIVAMSFNAAVDDKVLTGGLVSLVMNDDGTPKIEENEDTSIREIVTKEIDVIFTSIKSEGDQVTFKCLTQSKE